MKRFCFKKFTLRYLELSDIFLNIFCDISSHIRSLPLEELKKYPQQKRFTIPKIQTAWTRLKDLEDLEPSIDLKEQIKSYIASATIWEGTCLDFWKRNISRFPAFEPCCKNIFLFVHQLQQLKECFLLVAI